jgi:hypothetical protein
LSKRERKKERERSNANSVLLMAISNCTVPFGVAHVVGSRTGSKVSRYWPPNVICKINVSYEPGRMGMREWLIISGPLNNYFCWPTQIIISAGPLNQNF